MTPLLGITSPNLWYTSRATGIVSLVLLSGAMVLGIATTRRASSARWPRFAVSDLHRRVSLVAMVFLALHVVTTVVDTFVPIGLLAAVVPFTSHYRVVWVGLGTIAFDLLVAVTLSSLVRTRIAARTWRTLHWLVYLSWPTAVLHSLMVGTDTTYRWLLALVALCVASVLGALAWRLSARRPAPLAVPVPPAPPRRRSPQR